MNLKNITNLRINFNKSLPLIEKTYELKLKKLYKNEKKIEELIERKNLNYMNYTFLNQIQFKFYEKAILNYFKNIKKLEENDNTNIILLFFPEFLKSNRLENELDLENQKFNYSQFAILNKDKSYLESEIKKFFESYSNLNRKYRFVFHRYEMFNYLELFLNEYNSDDYKLVSEPEKREFATLHYFSCFLRPEVFYKREEFK